VSQTSPQPQSPRTHRPSFRPRALVGLLYFAALFLVFAMILILPELLPVLDALPPGPEQEALAEEVARNAARPRLPYAFLLALLTIALGAYYRVLPGLRP
jgi:hypothetical protein